MYIYGIDLTRMCFILKTNRGGKKVEIDYAERGRRMMESRMAACLINVASESDQLLS